MMDIQTKENGNVFSFFFNWNIT